MWGCDIMCEIVGEVKTFTKENSPTCMCEYPIKEHSKTTCTCCWWCKKCGKFGGCDNLYWISGMEQIPHWSDGTVTIYYPNNIIKENLKDE